MISAHHDLQRITIHRVDQSMLLADAPRPESTQVVLQRLGLADAAEGVALGISDQQIDALEPGLVVLLEPQVVIPGLGGEEDVHAHSLFIDQLLRPCLAGTQVVDRHDQSFGIGW